MSRQSLRCSTFRKLPKSHVHTCQLGVHQELDQYLYHHIYRCALWVGIPANSINSMHVHGNGEDGIGHNDRGPLNNNMRYLQIHCRYAFDHDRIVATMLYIQTSMHDQEIPESHTIDQPLVPRQNECVLIVLLFTIQRGMTSDQSPLEMYCQQHHIYMYCLYAWRSKTILLSGLTPQPTEHIILTA